MAAASTATPRPGLLNRLSTALYVRPWLLLLLLFALPQPGNLAIIVRTVTMAAAVTIACALLAFAGGCLHRRADGDHGHLPAWRQEAGRV